MRGAKEGWGAREGGPRNLVQTESKCVVEQGLTRVCPRLERTSPTPLHLPLAHIHTVVL